jgi:hypothetical protein
MIESSAMCAGQLQCRLLFAVWTHNPPVVGSSPTRPTQPELRLDGYRRAVRLLL